jgi:hypothetical protein
MVRRGLLTSMRAIAIAVMDQPGEAGAAAYRLAVKVVSMCHRNGWTHSLKRPNRVWVWKNNLADLESDWPWKILDDPGPTLAAISVGGFWNASKTMRFLGVGLDAYTIITLPGMLP